MTDTTQRVTDSLVRAWSGEQAISLREATGDGANPTLVGHMAVYNRWTEINSQYEGHFMERILPGAFDDAFANRERVKVLFNHGKDPSVGNKPLGTLDVFESRDGGAWYEVGLFDANYVNELKPALRAKVLGSSFRFGVPDGGDDWNTSPTRSAENPNGLPERSIAGLACYEGGPVTFPAYQDASAGLRSMTDDFAERMLNDPLFLARLVERAGLKNVEPLIESAREALGTEEERNEDETAGAADVPTISLHERRAVLARML